MEQSGEYAEQDVPHSLWCLGSNVRPCHPTIDVLLYTGVLNTSGLIGVGNRFFRFQQLVTEHALVSCPRLTLPNTFESYVFRCTKCYF